MSFIVGIDVGTSGVKTLVISETGEIITQATAEYPLYHPKAGWAEQDPEDWWQGTLTTLKKVAQDLGPKAKEVKAIGLSGQMHGSVFLDKAGKVSRPAILWCDVRTAEQCRYYNGKGRRPGKVDRLHIQSGSRRLHSPPRSSGCSKTNRRSTSR